MALKVKTMINKKSIFFITLVLFLVIIFFSSISSGKESINVVTVDDDGDGDFTTIQNAIDNVSENTTIYVYSGFYNGNITVDKSISIEGKQQELGEGIHTGLPIISGNNQNSVFLIYADGVTIENLNITRGNTSYFGAGIYLSSNDCIIKNNIIFNNKYGVIVKNENNSNLTNNIIQSNKFIDNIYGLNLFYTLETKIESNSFTNCSISLYGDFPNHFYHEFSNNLINNLPLFYATNEESLYINGEQKKYGEILLVNCSNSIITNMNISKTTIGTELAFCNHISFQNNTFSHCNVGIYDYQSSTTTLSNNQFRYNKETGSILYNSTNVEIIHNHYLSNYDGIINEYSYNSSIFNNTFKNNHNIGIYIRSNKNSNISQNILELNSGGIYSYNSNNDTISQNSILENTGNGILINNGRKILIFSNDIKNNNLNGIVMKEGTQNCFVSNNFIENSFQFGVYIVDDSNNNQLFHNYFRLNGIESVNGANAFDECINHWNLEYPLNWEKWQYNKKDDYCGNYWQNHQKVDIKKGPQQDQPGSDNIIDQPFKIKGGNNYDHYPILPIGITVFVDESGNGDFTSIQKAIDMTTIDTIIHVKNGTYKENIVINSPVTIIGSNETIIGGEGKGNVIVINHDYVTISHFIIQDSGPNEAAIQINTNKNKIYNNIIKNNNNGISLISSSENLIFNNTIKENNGIGIHLKENSQSNTIKNNTISKNYKGVKILSSCDFNTFYKNEIISNMLNGIELYYSEEITISNNIISKNNPGLLLSDALNCNVSENNFKECGMIFLQVESKKLPLNKIQHNTVNGKPLVYFENKENINRLPSAGQIILVNCTNFHIENQVIMNTSIGIELWNSRMGSVIKNNIFNTDKGLYLINSENNTLQSNTISKSNTGIIGYNISNNNFKSNSICENIHGIEFDLCKYNQITESFIFNNRYEGIELISSNFNLIKQNNITKNDYGLKLENSNENTIIQNMFITNYEGTLIEKSNSNKILNNNFFQDGLIVDFSEKNDLKNNTVNGKPLIYYEKESNKIIAEAGQIILIDCNNIHIKNLIIKNTPVGIYLWKTSNCVIENNHVSKNKKGIYFQQSISNTILSNTIKEIDTAIELLYSDQNKINNNTCLQNTFSIVLTQSDRNLIQNNTVSSTIYSGIKIHIGFENQIVNCTIFNTINGIELENAINTIIKNNKIWKNSRGIILSSSSYDNLISYCHILENEWGIKLGASHDNTIDHCTISLNAGGIRRGKDNRIIRNNFFDNGFHYLGEFKEKNYFFRNHWDNHLSILPNFISANNIDWFPKVIPFDFNADEQTISGIHSFLEEKYMYHHIDKIINLFQHQIEQIISLFKSTYLLC